MNAEENTFRVLTLAYLAPPCQLAQNIVHAA